VSMSKRPLLFLTALANPSGPSFFKTFLKPGGGGAKKHDNKFFNIFY